MLGELLMVSITDLFTLSASERAIKREAAAARTRGKVVGALRLREGKVEGLSRDWRTAEISVAPWSLDIGDRDLAVSLASTTFPSGATAFPVSPIPKDVLIDLRSGDARIQLAVMGEDIERVINGLRGS